jgi:hypothetical protein
MATRRKEFAKAPGVSIAVINNFKVEWAKAYGVKDVETDEDLRFLSPLIRQHLGLYGKYDFDLQRLEKLPTLEQFSY